MLKKELAIGLVIVGVVSPLTIYADHPNSSISSSPTYISGEILKPGELPGGYNQSADYKLDDSYGVYFTSDFIYWNLQQDLVRLGNIMTTDSSGALGLLDGSGETVFMDTKYAPGFQVGLGFNMEGIDGWNFYSEYTWYQNTNSYSRAAHHDQVVVPSGLREDVVSGIATDIIVAEKAKMKSQYHYNNLNLTVQRPFYFGRRVTANFGVGLRGLFVTQTVTTFAEDISSYHSGDVTKVDLGEVLATKFYQKMWGLGPRFEFGTNWLLGYGFRIIADLAASVLYTSYTNLSGSVEGAATLGIVADLQTRVLSNYNTLRAVTETSLGFGWGSYFGNNNDFHFDLSAGYEFNVYWNQNMLGMVVNASGSPGNTYLHGLNIAARLDF